MKILMILAGCLFACCVSATAFAADEALWVDVRSAEEFDAGHLPGAVNIAYTDIADEIGRYATDKNQPIRLYCRSGRRAGIAKQTLESLGYINVSNEGGHEALMESQVPRPVKPVNSQASQ